tara:strand:- start:17 stop:376 length:360 start_codon:yes stop_codon:yes gene_type:complete
MRLIHPYTYVGIVEHEKQLIRPELALNNLLEIITRVYDIESHEIVGHSRKRQLVEVRQMCYYILRQYYKLTFKGIGQLFNNRDHATILHGCDRHKDDYQYCFDYKKKYDYIFNQHALSW